jgi:hypothetical protein
MRRLLVVALAAAVTGAAMPRSDAQTVREAFRS